MKHTRLLFSCHIQIRMKSWQIFHLLDLFLRSISMTNTLPPFIALYLPVKQQELFVPQIFLHSEFIWLSSYSVIEYVFLLTCSTYVCYKLPGQLEAWLNSSYWFFHRWCCECCIILNELSMHLMSGNSGILIQEVLATACI